jgi:5-methylcytosine-specific restriction enzyme A
MSINRGRNPPWEREELILALDLYFEANPNQISDLDHRVINLSNILKKMNIPATTQNLENFRNPNSVYMKMCNFLALDPSYYGSGLTRGSKLDKIIWDEFSSNPILLRKAAINILHSKSDQNKSFNELDHEKNKKIFREVIAIVKKSEKKE